LDARDLIYSIVGGIVVTLLTAFIPNTPGMLLGAVWYGFPMEWLIRMVVAPQFFPYTVNMVNMILDVVFWAVIIGLILGLVKRIR
jgi:hypothetical protein